MPPHRRLSRGRRERFSGPPTLCPGGLVRGFANSDLTYTSDSPVMGDRLPLVQQYSLDFQYELAHSWVVDIGYVGTHSIHLYNYGQGVNLRLVGPRRSEQSDRRYRTAERGDGPTSAV